MLSRGLRLRELINIYVIFSVYAIIHAFSRTLSHFSTKKLAVIFIYFLSKPHFSQNLELSPFGSHRTACAKC